MDNHSTDEIRFERRGPWGLVTLTRERALNSLTLGMVTALGAALTDWAADPGVRAVLVRGEGERAFCAGGDIRYMHDTAKDDPVKAADFFRAEYRTNTLMQGYAKPIVALMDGVVMGGGVGISAPARYSVVTERTMWAMPECGIGLVPDVGASWHLNQLADGMGLWLGLTGERLNGASCVEVGLADALVASDALDDLTAALMAAKLDGNADKVIARVLDAAHEPEAADIDPPLAFEGKPPLEGLLSALRASTDPGAAEALAKIERASPTSVALTHRLITEAPNGFADAIAREFRVAAHLMEGPDFIEGVRAQVIDKDRNPQWSPRALSDVSADMLSRYFDIPDGGDLDLTGLRP